MSQKLSKPKNRLKRVLIIILVTVLSYAVFSVAGAAIAFKFIFARTDTVNAFELTYNDIDNVKYPRENISFLSGKNRLNGCVYKPEGNSRALVIVSNGMNSCLDRHLPEILRFVDSGFAVMTFENTGVGKSEGDGTVGIAQARLDLNAAVDYAQSDSALKSLPVVLYGHSLGGYAAAVSQRDMPCVRAAVCVSGFDSPNLNMYYSAKKRVGILADLQYPFICLQNYFLFGDRSDDSAVSAINESGKPVMVAGGTSDDTVPDEISLLNRADGITNPNAVIVEISEKYRAEHSTVWLSSDAAKYLAETENPTDKARANELDKDFMDSVKEFYLKAVEG